jgi:Prokaryotic cytochrome b561.
MEEIHETVAMIFLFTLVLHVFAVLWHAVIRRDGLAARMIPFLSR